MTDSELELEYPGIPWREPIAVQVPGRSPRRFACRFCIARRGLRGSDVERLPLEPGPVERHIREAHPREPEVASDGNGSWPVA